MLSCPCPRCENTDDMAICENALLAAQISVAKSEQFLLVSRWSLVMLTFLFVLAVLLALKTKG